MDVVILIRGTENQYNHFNTWLNDTLMHKLYKKISDSYGKIWMEQIFAIFAQWINNWDHSFMNCIFCSKISKIKGSDEDLMKLYWTSTEDALEYNKTKRVEKFPKWNSLVVMSVVIFVFDLNYNEVVENKRPCSAKTNKDLTNRFFSKCLHIKIKFSPRRSTGTKVLLPSLLAPRFVFIVCWQRRKLFMSRSHLGLVNILPNN